MAALGIAILHDKTQQAATRDTRDSRREKAEDFDGAGLDPGFIEECADSARRIIAMAGVRRGNFRRTRPLQLFRNALDALQKCSMAKG